MELIYLYYFFVFYLGTILGSFLNVVTLDIEKLFNENDLEHRNELFFFTRHISKRYFWQSLLTRRSHCDSCGKTLHTFELFPVFSYLLQRGKCSACGEKIDPSHLWVELLCGGYFLGVFYVLFWQAALFSSAFIFTILFWFLVFGALFILALFDYRTQLIPDVVLFFVSVLVIVHQVVTDSFSWMNIAAAVTMSGMFYLVWWFSRGQWIGFADGKLAGLIGLLLGFSAGFTALAISFWAGAIVCIILLSLGKLFRRTNGLSWGESVPFGPFMVFGIWYVFVTGINLFQLAI